MLKSLVPFCATSVMMSQRSLPFLARRRKDALLAPEKRLSIMTLEGPLAAATCRGNRGVPRPTPTLASPLTTRASLAEAEAVDTTRMLSAASAEAVETLRRAARELLPMPTLPALRITPAPLAATACSLASGDPMPMPTPPELVLLMSEPEAAHWLAPAAAVWMEPSGNLMPPPLLSMRPTTVSVEEGAEVPMPTMPS